jgi:hypothetical protein
MNFIHINQYLGRWCPACNAAVETYMQICPRCQAPTEAMVNADQLREDMNILLGNWLSGQLNLNREGQFTAIFPDTPWLGEYASKKAALDCLTRISEMITDLIAECEQLTRAHPEVSEATAILQQELKGVQEAIAQAQLDARTNPPKNPLETLFMEYTRLYVEATTKDVKKDLAEMLPQPDPIAQQLATVKDRIEWLVEKAKGYATIAENATRFRNETADQNPPPPAIAHIAIEYAALHGVFEQLLSIRLFN